MDQAHSAWQSVVRMKIPFIPCETADCRNHTTQRRLFSFLRFKNFEFSGRCRERCSRPLMRPSNTCTYYITFHLKFQDPIYPICISISQQPRLPTEAMNKNKRPLGMIRRNINRRKPHQRICRNAHLVTIEVKVNVHAGSLHEAMGTVNKKSK